MRIRTASLEDLRIILSLNKVLRVPGSPWYYWHTKKYILPPLIDRRFFLAEDEGKPAGAISLAFGEGEVEIRTLAVSKRFRGRGVGATLVRFAVARARMAKKQWLRVETLSFYGGACDFYRKQGFRLSRSGPHEGAYWYEFVLRLT